eukprot:TRINITY_DN377_c0_g2_i1.p1 TRINITY_DN377_c0_g2~~TRINITY_DN377_c0_g2_i1.p1  ORF type:complete len:577 (-),score=209.19 TRINITY_DN377_c0_g2_i1:45-1775(-)
MEQPLYNDSFAEFDITPYSSSLQQLADLPSPTLEEPSVDSTGNTPYPTNDDLVPPPYEAGSSDNFTDLTPSLLDQQTPSPVSTPPRSQSLYQQPIAKAAETSQRTPTQAVVPTNQPFGNYSPQQVHQVHQAHQLAQQQQQAQLAQQQAQQLAQQQAQQLAQQQAQQAQRLAQQQAQQLAQQQAQQQAQQLAQQQAQQAQQQAQAQQQQAQKQQEQMMDYMLKLQQAQQQQMQQQMQQQAQAQQQQEALRQQQQAAQLRQQSTPNPAQAVPQQPTTTVHSHPIQNSSNTFESYGYPQISSPQVASVYPSIPQVQSVQNLYGQNTNQQTKDALNQIQTYFDKISGFMERLDRRMAALEVTAQNIAKNQPESGVRSEVSSLKKMQNQAESDFDVAKRLQDELNQKYEKEKRREEKRKSKAAAQAKLSSSGTTPRPTMTTPSNSSVQECPICAVKVPIADLEVHVNVCLEGTEKPTETKTPDNGEKPSIWKRVFGPGPKKEDTPTPPPSTAIVPANRMPPPMRPITTPGVYGQEYYPQPQPQQGAYMYRPYGQPTPPPQVYGYPGQQPIYYYNPNMPPKR